MQRALLRPFGSTYLIVASCAILTTLASCEHLRDPLRRTAHEYVRPDGAVVRCYEPPPDVVPIALRAEVEAKIPRVIEILNARLGVEETFERIRPASEDMQVLEVLEFRLCVAWAQGALADDAYQEFLVSILPHLRRACPAGNRE